MASVFKRGGKANKKGNWLIEWTDHTGKRRTDSSKTTDRATAERIGKKWEADAALRRAGVIDAVAEQVTVESRRPIEEHLTAFENRLKAAGRSQVHISDTTRQIRAFIAEGRFLTASTITSEAVERYAAKLKSEYIAAGTIRSYLTAMKSFTKWLTAEGKLDRDPLVRVSKPSAETDRRHERRMLHPDEWDYLSHYLATENVERFNIPADERIVLYATAIQTGLRSSELRSLTPGRLYLDASPAPYLTCKAGSTKNRTDARQYLKPDLAACLGRIAATRKPGQAVFRLPHTSDMATMLRRDLEAARKAWVGETVNDAHEHSRRGESDFLAIENHDGETLDFHALRHTCGAWLAKAGNHPKVVQTIMRHSTITLTMDTYGHLFPGQESEAIATLPDMVPLQWKRQWSGDNPVQQFATACSPTKDHQRTANEANPWKDTPFGGFTKGSRRPNEVKAVGLEPTTYGLKVRCSTD